MTAAPYFQPRDNERRANARTAFAVECAFASENLEAHALHALDDDEAARVERHASTCPGCAEKLERCRALAACLPFLAKPVSAPDRALAGIFAKINSDQSAPLSVDVPGLNPWAADAPARSWTIPSSGAAFAPAAAASRTQTRKRRVNWNVWAAPLAAMPLVFALAIVGGWALNTRANLQDQKSALLQAKKENQSLSAQLLANPQSTAVADMSGEDFTLKSVNSSGAKGALTKLSSSTDVSVQVWNLPSGVKTCEIEVEAMDGRRTSAGMIDINSAGSGNGTYSLQQPLDQYRYVHVVPVTSGSYAGRGSTDLLMAQINANLGDSGGTAADALAH